MKTILFVVLMQLSLLANIGTIAAMKGDVSINRDAKDITAKMGSKIQNKDTLTTQKNAKVQVIMIDETVITIGSNSKYSFEEYGDDHAQMKIERGFFRAITGKIGKIAPEKFKIKTKSATIGIRGTHFSAMVADKTEVIKCIRGKITVTTAKKTYIIPEGMMITLANNSWSQQPIDMKKSKTRTKKPNTSTDENIKKQNINVQEIESLGNRLDAEIIVPTDIPSFDPDK